MIIRVKNHHMPPMIRVDSALGISSEPGVGEGGGGGGKRKQRERTRFIYTYVHYTHTYRYKGLGFTVKTVRAMQLKPTVFEANHPDILHARKSVGFL